MCADAGVWFAIKPTLISQFQDKLFHHLHSDARSCHAVTVPANDFTIIIIRLQAPGKSQQETPGNGVQSCSWASAPSPSSYFLTGQQE